MKQATMMARRKLAALAAALVGLTFISAGPAQADTMVERTAHKPLVIATEDSYKPFEYMDGDKPVGLDNELYDMLKAGSPYPMQHQILPWTGLLAGVSSGKYDAAITGALVDKDRAATFDFSMPIAEVRSYYVKRKKDDTIKSIKDLSGKTLGVQAGSVLLARLPELKAMLESQGGKLGKVVQYQSYPEAYQDLAGNRVDYVVNTQVSLISLAKERPGVFEVGSEPVSGASYIAWPVRKGDKQMLDFLNGFLKSVRDSGKLVELQQKWLGVSFKDLPDEVPAPSF